MSLGIIDVIFLLGFIYWFYMKIKHSSQSNLLLKVLDYIFGFCLGILMLAIVMFGFIAVIAYIADNHMDIVRNLMNDYGGYLLLAMGVLLFFNSAEKFSKLSPDEQKKFFEKIHQNEVERKQRKDEEKQREIDELERERSYIKRSNNILDDLTGSGLSKSELRQNQKLYNKMGREIQDKRRELND